MKLSEFIIYFEHAIFTLFVLIGAIFLNKNLPDYFFSILFIIIVIFFVVLAFSFKKSYFNIKYSNSLSIIALISWWIIYLVLGLELYILEKVTNFKIFAVLASTVIIIIALYLILIKK